MEPRLGSPEDRKHSIVVAIGVFLPIILFACRPATLLGIDGNALSASITGLRGECSQVEDELWLCKTSYSTSSEGGTHTVTTRPFGCWDAWNGDRPITDRDPTDSGCIHLFDYL